MLTGKNALSTAPEAEDKFAVTFVDRKGIRRTFDNLSLDETAALLPAASIREPFTVTEIPHRRAA
jgi:hypothetical protein